jgi:hypothetical protein
LVTRLRGCPPDRRQGWQADAGHQATALARQQLQLAAMLVGRALRHGQAQANAAGAAIA